MASTVTSTARDFTNATSSESFILVLTIQTFSLGDNYRLAMVWLVLSRQ
jgi:hypothetical protein